jgi:hypothetical protein|tara:strand:- start:969 stop:1145 length:177 start_codon:yes stop_codon:yes gene_type:complete
MAEQKPYCIEFHDKKKKKLFGHKTIFAFTLRQAKFLFIREFGRIYTIERIRLGACGLR